MKWILLIALVILVLYLVPKRHKCHEYHHDYHYSYTQDINHGNSYDKGDKDDNKNEFLYDEYKFPRSHILPPDSWDILDGPSLTDLTDKGDRKGENNE